jgi:O-succinylbenzoic acid--CoA ligase
MKIQCPISYYAEKMPGFPAVINRQGIYCYQHLHENVSGMTGYLAGKGIKKKTRVALLGRNSHWYIVVLAALWRIGAVAVPLNFRLPPNRLQEIIETFNIAYIIEDSDDDYRLENRGSAVALDWKEIAIYDKQRPVKPHPAGHIDLANDAVIILTSGSTGAGKAVLLTYGNLHYNALGSNGNIIVLGSDRWLLSLPLFHVGGLGILFRCFLGGAAIVVPDPGDLLHETAAEQRITHISLVPTQLQELIEKIERTPQEYEKLNAVLLGGSAFSTALIQRALWSKLPLYTTYGLSEMASQVTATPPNAPPDKLTSSGKALKYRSIKIDTNGEIRVKGPTLFKGYIENGKVSCPLDPGGWFRTGDLGRFDEDGYLHVSGRLDNMFISGGENIMPEEIENLLNRFPGIKRSLVTPVKDKTYGSRPVVFLDLAYPGAIKKSGLLNYLEENLPRYKIPDYYYLWPDERPGQKTLKIIRADFREKINRPGKLTLLFKR